MARAPRFNRGFSRKSRRSTRQIARRVLSSERLEDRQLLAAQAAFAPGEIIVGFEGDLVAEFRTEGPGRALQSAAARFGGVGLERGEALLHRPAAAHGGERLPTLWKLPPGKDVFEAAKVLSQLPGVAYAEPNYLLSATETQEFPNDPSFNTLWGMHNTGQSGGTADADIDAPEAWGLHTGTGDVVVAVIDSGVNYNHTDLTANIWTNPFEIAGNGIDDDGNGYADDIRGYDFINNDANPMDDNGHGTHVAGTIGATGDNGKGVVGVNWNVKIMPLKFLGDNNGGLTSDAIRAVQYATDMRNRGVNVVLTSNSWGGGAYTQALYDAIAASGQEGMLFIAAAMNNGNTSPVYPAYYDLDNIISVAATDRHDQLASFSNRGEWVDIAAPGVSVYSTYNKNYATLSGTSMATPHVAGAAALVADYLKTEMGALPSYQDVRDAILNSGDQIAALQNTVATGSRLNAHGAMLHADVLAGNATGLAIADVSLLEGDAGPATVTLTVMRSGRLDTTTTVHWATANGTATAPNDFTAASGYLTFAPFETSQQIEVTVLGDTSIESHENFNVVLSAAANSPSGVGVTLLRAGATVSILTDDVGLSIGDTTVNEGDEQIGPKGEFISSGAGGLVTPYSMIYGPDGNLYVSDITANRVFRYDAATGAPLPAPGQSGADFVPAGSGGLSAPRQITFGPDGNLYAVSESTHSILRFDGITGAFAGDFVASGAGGLSFPRGLWFHTDGYVYVASVGLEDPAPGKDAILRYDAVTGAPAGVSGLPGDAVFVPSGSGGLDNPSQVVLHNGHLYVSSTSQTPDAVLRFDGLTGSPFPAPGRTDALFVPPGNELDGPVDMVFRPDGLYVTSWRNDSVIRYGATTGSLDTVVVPPGMGGIDSPIALLFEPQGTFLVRGNNSRVLRYGPASVAAFTVSLSSAAGAPITVNYASVDGTAIGDSTTTVGDYQPVASAVTFAPGETTKTIVVATRDDNNQESSETFSVNLSSADAVVLDAQGIGTIVDDDSLPEVVNYASTNVPKAIPSPGTVTSTINVPDSFSVVDIDVRLDITHSFDGDLSVHLIGPDGTRVKLFAGIYGGNGKNFTGTVLDDEAAVLITNGTAPFTGRFRPQASLSAFDSKNATGTWTLEISDLDRPRNGTLNSWSIDFTRGAGSPTSSAIGSLAVISTSDDGDPGISALDSAAVDQLLSDGDSGWTHKSRVKVLV